MIETQELLSYRVVLMMYWFYMYVVSIITGTQLSPDDVLVLHVCGIYYHWYQVVLMMYWFYMYMYVVSITTGRQKTISPDISTMM